MGQTTQDVWCHFTTLRKQSKFVDSMGVIDHNKGEFMRDFI